MRWASARGLGLGVLAAAGCGLFHSEPDLPGWPAVELARRLQAGEWDLLKEAVELYRSQGAAAWPGLEALLEEHPGSVRLHSLIQDLEVDRDGREEVWRRAVRRHQEEPSGLNAYLAARQADRDQALALLDDCLRRSPGMPQAVVLKIGLEARLGEPEVLEDLIRLLQRQPGLAEAWLLLGQLAPLYARYDLARAAARTQPWSPVEPPDRARLLEAAMALKDRDSVGALRSVATLAGGQRDLRLIRAAALADAGRVQEAWDILQDLLLEHPDDPQIHFNLGLMAWNYLGRDDLAIQHLRRFLELMEAGADVPLERRLQAELWLDRLENPPQ